MEEMMKCPVCGTENKRAYYTESIGIVEDYYNCNHCGYGYEMCCSPVHEYINLSNTKVNWFDSIKEAWNRRVNNE